MVHIATCIGIFIGQKGETYINRSSSLNMKVRGDN